MTDSLSPMVADGGAVMEPACASGFRVGDQYCSHSKKIREKIRELRPKSATRPERLLAALLVDALPDARPPMASDGMTASACTPALGPFLLRVAHRR